MIQVNVTGRVLIISSLFFLLVGVGTLANSRAQIAAETGLDPDLFATLTVDVGGKELSLFMVYVNERAFDSGITRNEKLRQILLLYVESNALYINPNVKQVVDSFNFFPHQISVEQVGKPTFIPTANDWVEITPGFLEGRFQVNPKGPSYGSGSEGLLVMGEHIDPSQPFWVAYQGQRARFDLAEPTAVIPPVTSPIPTPSVVSPRETVEIPTLKDITDLEDALTHGDFSSKAVATLLGLDPRLVGTTTITSGGEELRLLLVRLEEGVQEGAFGAELLSNLEPLIGTGAVMLWALTPTGANFSPWQLHVQQSQTIYDFWFDSSFVELTEGFLRLGRLESGKVVAGVILLHRQVNPYAAFTIYYQTINTAATFPNLPQQ
jgi:hypothetical protein